MSANTCKCGCGTPSLPGRAYAQGHHFNQRPVEYVVDSNGCWVWQGGRDVKGYGKLEGRRAHRVYYERYVGPIPAGLQIDHLCRNTGCCNPNHLDAVTSAENVRRSPRVKLDMRKAIEIRQRLATGEKGVRLAEEFGVTPQMICRIKKGLTYR